MSWSGSSELNQHQNTIKCLAIGGILRTLHARAQVNRLESQFELTSPCPLCFFLLFFSSPLLQHRLCCFFFFFFSLLRLSLDFECVSCSFLPNIPLNRSRLGSAAFWRVLGQIIWQNFTLFSSLSRVRGLSIEEVDARSMNPIIGARSESSLNEIAKQRRAARGFWHLNLLICALSGRQISHFTLQPDDSSYRVTIIRDLSLSDAREPPSEPGAAVP